MATAKILIVDESPARAERLAAIVREAGFDVVRAAGGGDAVDRARAERPDLILVDVVPPQVDGYEVCRELRSDRAVRHIPLIAVAAARGTEAEPLWARMQGASDFVDATYTAEKLLGAIRTAL